MRQDDTAFFSDGLRLDASFFLPDDKPGDSGTLLACSGFTGLKAIHPSRFSRAFTARGWRCFGFDYRGFGASQGNPGQVVLDEQIRDMASAVTFVRSRCPGPVYLLGWGMGAGLALEAAQLAPVEGLICLNGFYDGRRVQREVRGAKAYEEFLEWLDAERRQAVENAQRKLYDPFDLYPLDPLTRTYVDGELRRYEGYGGEFDLVLAESLLTFRPEANLEELAGTPLYIAHGTENGIHPAGEARSLLARYPGPRRMNWLEGANHTEWMYDDDPRFCDLIEDMAGWLKGL